MYNVLIVEDDPMARKLLEIFVSTSEKYHLVPSLDSAAMAELYCMTNQVDLVLMDVCTAMDMSGIEAAAKLKKNYPAIKIIIITITFTTIILLISDRMAICLETHRIFLSPVEKGSMIAFILCKFSCST